MSASPDVRVTNLHPKKKLPLARIKSLSIQALKLLKQKSELHVTFVSDSQIRVINKVFHGINLPTDVLAFPVSWKMKKTSHKDRFLGEVIISIDRAVIYAKRFKVTPDQELIRYLIHGALHLLGERDHKLALRKKMFERQESLINQLKIPKLL